MVDKAHTQYQSIAQAMLASILHKHAVENPDGPQEMVGPRNRRRKRNKVKIATIEP